VKENHHLADMTRKEAVGKIKPMLNNKRQWDAFCRYIDLLVEDQHRKLEQSVDAVSIHRAQGAIETLRKLKYMRDEVKD